MLQQIKKTTTTMNTDPIEYISELEFMKRIINGFPEITENDYKNALNYNKRNVIYIPERFQTQEMWNLYAESTYFVISVIPKKFQTPQMWNQILRDHYICMIRYRYRQSTAEDDENEDVYPSELITKKTFEIVRKFSIPEEDQMWIIEYLSDLIWKKRCAFCTIINQPGFERTTKLNLDVLKLVASFI
jgi:hypothetical protein